MGVGSVVCRRPRAPPFRRDRRQVARNRGLGEGVCYGALLVVMNARGPSVALLVRFDTGALLVPIGRVIRLRPARRAILFATLAASLVLPVSCTDTLAPAVPTGGIPELRTVGEPPMADLSRRRNAFRTPEDVLNTLALAIDSKSKPGAFLYIRAFSDPTANIGTRTFRAEYDPAVLAAWQASSNEPAPENWGLALERKVPLLLSVIRPQDRYDFRWAPDPNAPNDQIEGDVALISRHYTLVASSASDTGGEIIALGTCDLSLELAHGRWSIFGWVDHVDPSAGPNPADGARSFTYYRLSSLSFP